jgi:uracil-DNA glycosylase
MKAKGYGNLALLRVFLADRFTGWPDDLQQQSDWPRFLEGCPPPGVAQVSEALEIAEEASVWPGRLAARHANAPEGSHVCLPFEHIEPSDVRVVVLGQDPYPTIEAATGRAFEDGTPDAAARALRPALRVLGQSALDVQGQALPEGFCHGLAERAETIRRCFDRLAEQGVLCLNASWTYTESAHLSAHRSFWNPVSSYLVRQLTRRPEGCPVFLLLGGEAQQFFDRLHLEDVPPEAIVRNRHPTERDNLYFAEPNPLKSVNEAIRRVNNTEPIEWWSRPVDRF